MLVAERLLLLCALCVSGAESQSEANREHDFTPLSERPETANTSQDDLQPNDHMLLTTSATASTPETFCFSSSCRGRCGRASFFGLKQMCSCDEVCPVFKDCCLDFISLCTNETEGLVPGHVIPTPRNTPYTSCVYYHGSQSVYMVTKCPDGYKNQAVKELCEENPNNLLISHVPVSEYRSVYTYRNLYCAICHSQDVQNLKPFYTHYNCNSSDTQFKEYMRKKPVAEITLNDTKEGCWLVIFSTYRVRRCAVVDLESCSDPPAPNDTCAAYMDPVTLSFTQPSGAVQTVTARNKHCIHCNHLTESLLSSKCWTAVRTRVARSHLTFAIHINLTAVDIPDGSLIDLTNPSTRMFRGIPNSYPVEEFDKIFLNFLLTNQNEEEKTRSDLLASLSTILEFKDITLTECVQLGAGKASTEKRNLIHAYQMNTTSSYDLHQLFRFIEFFGNFASDLANHGRNISGTLRNTRSPIEEVCISPPRFYQEKEFHERLKTMTAKFNVVQQNVSLQLQFPIEIIFVEGNTHGSFSNCPDFTDYAFTEDISFPIFKVCGDTIEEQCQVTIYDVKDLSTATIYKSPSRLIFLYQTESVTATCGEIFTGMVVFYLTVIGCSLSVMGLAVTVGTFWSFQKLRHSTGTCDVNFICALLMTQCLFGVGEVVAWRHVYVCQVVAVLQHFFWLGSFCWTNVMAFDLARTFSGTATILKEYKGRRRLIQYLLVAWGLPLVVVTTTVTLNYTDTVSVLYGEFGICSIREKYALLAFFVAPVGLHVLFNIGCFSFSVYNIRRISRITDDIMILSERRAQLGVCTRITVIMGFAFLIGYLSYLWPLPALRILFSGVNSLQGVFVTMNFILTSQVIKTFRGRLFRESITSRKTSIAVYN